MSRSRSTYPQAATKDSPNEIKDLPAAGVELKALSMDRELASEIQIQLRDLDILDPPVDGAFGSISQLGLQQFASRVGLRFDETVTKPLAEALIANNADVLFPLELKNDFASRIVKYMQIKNYWLARPSGYLNIVYVEGVEEDGTLNDDAPNKFNDRRLLVEIKNKKPTLVGNWEATTEPGRKLTLNPENPKGAARIAFGQYKSWQVGVHKRGRPSAHEALVQVENVTVHRDLNKDFKRTLDKTDVGSGFGINQHKGFNMPVGDIGLASAGCLVGRTNKGHEEFMAKVKTDLRFKKLQGYKFMTTVIAGDDLKKLVG